MHTTETIERMAPGDQLLSLIQDVANAERAASAILKPQGIEEPLRDMVSTFGISAENAHLQSPMVQAQIGIKALQAYFDFKSTQDELAQIRLHREAVRDTLSNFIDSQIGKEVQIEALNVGVIYLRCGPRDADGHDIKPQKTITSIIHPNSGLRLPGLLTLPKGRFGVREYEITPLNRMTLQPQVNITIED